MRHRPLKQAAWLKTPFDLTAALATDERLIGRIPLPGRAGSYLDCFEIYGANGGNLYNGFAAMCNQLGLSPMTYHLAVYRSDARDGDYHNNGMQGEFELEGQTHRLIVISDGLIALATQEELLTFIGHELGHIAKGHTLKGQDENNECPLYARKEEIEADDVGIELMGREPMISLHEKLRSEKAKGNFSGPLIRIKGFFTRSDDTCPSHAVRIAHAQQRSASRDDFFGR